MAIDRNELLFHIYIIFNMVTRDIITHLLQDFDAYEKTCEDVHLSKMVS